MDILFLLVPLSLALIVFIIWGVWWAVNTDQFESLEQQGMSILLDQEQGVATSRGQDNLRADSQSQSTSAK